MKFRVLIASVLLTTITGFAQDFRKVVDIVVEMETGLKGMIAREEHKRKNEIARLTKEVEELKRLLGLSRAIANPETTRSDHGGLPEAVSRTDSPEQEKPMVRAAGLNVRRSEISGREESADTVAPGFWRGAALTGDWNGGRAWMSNHGLELSAVLKNDGFLNTHGGVSRTTALLRNIDFTLGVDAENLMGWSGGSVFVHVLSNNGGDLSSHVGDAQVVSNIEAPRITKLYQAWVQQALWQGSVSLRVGLYDLNSEFYVTETSGLFLNSSHGIGKEYSQTGRNGPSIFPNTSAGARVVVRPGSAWYFQAVALDAVPGTPDDPSQASFSFSKEDGVLLNAEAGYRLCPGDGEGPGMAKVALGAWRYTAPFERFAEVDEAGNPVRCTDNWGVYLLAEKLLYAEPGSSGQGLAGFVRFGRASSCVNQFDYHFGVGVVYTGLLPGRDEDQLGIAVAHAHNGDEYVRAADADGQRMLRRETTAEMTYKAQLTPWLAFQPDLQYVIHPGADPRLANALVVGTRLQVSF